MESNNLNRLKVVLAEKNISNKALSEILGVSQATISKWVTNTSQPHLDMLIKISKELDVDLKDLVRM
jgi:transcriptional regulator with XRE-family HTH domain